MTCLDGPALCVSNHQANGETILRSGKIVKGKNDIHGMWNYSKLCFNTKYPWESAPVLEDASMAKGEVEAQQYVLRDLTRADGAEDILERANVTLWHGQKEGVLYRRQFFNDETGKECHWMNALDLADFPVPYGMMRADRLRLYGHPVSLTLGAYGFPDNGTEVICLEEQGAKAVVLKGRDFCGREKQLAMTVYDGWDELAWTCSEGTNPDSAKSVVLYAKTARRRQISFRAVCADIPGHYEGKPGGLYGRGAVPCEKNNVYRSGGAGKLRAVYDRIKRRYGADSGFFRNGRQNGAVKEVTA